MQFSGLAPGYAGLNGGRTVLNGLGLNNWDIGVEKTIPLASEDSVRRQFRAEAFNAWNHNQFQQPNGNAGDSANFGRVSAARSPRLLQIGMKLVW